MVVEEHKSAYACNEVDRVPLRATWGPQWLHADAGQQPAASIEVNAGGQPQMEVTRRTTSHQEPGAIYPAVQDSEIPQSPSIERLAIGDIDRAANPGPLSQCDRCGSSGFRDVPIHDGQSVRRDCARCHRFLGWPVWYGNTIADEILAIARSNG